MKQIICINNDESEFDKIYDWTNKQKVLKDKAENENDKVKSTCCRIF